MSLEIDVLRALLRLARRRSAPSLDQIVVRVGEDEPSVRTALRSLARRGLVQHMAGGLRLSLPGLAVAVACAQRPRPAVSAAAPRPVALPRRRRTARAA